jgi:tetratricopeptide (TPR) repeat protein
VDSQGSLGKRIRFSRIRKGLSQAQLALPELSDSYISLIESGKRVPTPDVVRLLARKLGCSASYLTSGIDEDAQQRMRTTLEYAEIALQNGEAVEARDRFAELLANPDLDALPEFARKARWGHAMALESAGELEGALRELAALAESLSPEYDTDEWCRLHIVTSRCHREMGDLVESVRVAEDAFAQVTAIPGPWSDETVKLGSTLAGVYLMGGDLVSARQLTDRLIERADELGSPVARMAAYWQAAIVAGQQSDLDTAVRHAQRALALLGEATDPRNLSRLRAQYGQLILLADASNVERAREELLRAMEEMTETAAGEIDIAWCLTELARAEIVMGEPDRAADRIGEALRLLGDGPRLATAGALIVLAEAQMRLGDAAEAVEVIDRATACLEQMEPSLEAAEGWFHVADLLAETGPPERQAEAYRRALACAGL